VTQEKIEAGVRDLLAQVTQTDPGSVGPGFHCSRAPGWSSLQHLMLVSQLESRFGVTFSNREIPELTTYDAIVAALANRLGAG
jgi:acyl carrier protein